MEESSKIERAAKLIGDADGLLITAGAGMGVDPVCRISAAMRGSGMPILP